MQKRPTHQATTTPTKKRMSLYFRTAVASNPTLVESHAHNTKTAFSEIRESLPIRSSESGEKILATLDAARNSGRERTRCIEGPSQRDSHHLVNENSKVVGLSVKGGSYLSTHCTSPPKPRSTHRIDALHQSIAATIEEDLREYQKKVVQFHTPVAW